MGESQMKVNKLQELLSTTCKETKVVKLQEVAALKNKLLAADKARARQILSSIAFTLGSQVSSVEEVSSNSKDCF